MTGWVENYKRAKADPRIDKAEVHADTFVEPLLVWEIRAAEI